MSVQTESSRVARIEKAIADLKAKAAKKREDAAKKHQAAQRARESISRNTSTSMVKQKMRTADKADEDAAKLEGEAAKYEGQAADKGSSLANAQRSLANARKQEASKEEREAKTRRRDELRDLKRIEAARRAAQAPAEPVFVPHSVVEPEAPRSPAGYPAPYDVALSFAGEQRAYVALVAEALEAKRYRVFYDETEVLQTWGKELTELFDWVYRKGSRTCVMFISEDYERKEWTTLERRSALARALEEDEYVLPVRFDDTELAGVRPTLGYVSAADYAPNSLADLIAEKLGPPMVSEDLQDE